MSRDPRLTPHIGDVITRVKPKTLSKTERHVVAFDTIGEQEFVTYKTESGVHRLCSINAWREWAEGGQVTKGDEDGK